MAGQPSSPTSFSPFRRWRILFSVLLSTLAVAALVIMANYLGGRHFLRFALSAQSRAPLSPQTLGLLKSITNDVKVVIYISQAEEPEMYVLIKALLEEYRDANPKIQFESVDYVRDAGPAQVVAAQYKLHSKEAKDLVIFESMGRIYFVPVKLLPGYDYKLERGPEGTRANIKLESFKGEQFFDGALLAVTSDKQKLACFVTGHGEHDPEDKSPVGYFGFLNLLDRNFVRAERLQLQGTNTVPTNCNLLIIAGPTKKFLDGELDKIRQHLARGGALLVLFNAANRQLNTGLEGLLANWGVEVGHNRIIDQKHSLDLISGTDLIVSDFRHKHPLVDPLQGSALQVIQPRTIRRLASAPETPGAPTVVELAFAAAGSSTDLDPTPTPEHVPLVVAVEKAREATRIVVVGDSYCLDNQLLESESNCNADFGDSVINWLLDRSQMMGGVGPRTITEYKLSLTRSQTHTLMALFLAGVPGGILALGGLVWLRRETLNMHPRNTKILVALAAGLFAFIYFFERHWGAPVVVDTRVLPGFSPAAVRSIQIQAANQPAIRAERTNGGWQLTAPQSYPAQGAAIDSLLQKLETLTYDTLITAKDLRNKPKVNEEFGFDQALYTITLEHGPEPQRVKIGRLTPPGNQVYLQVVGRPDIDVLGLELLGLLPGPTNDWRDTTFVNLKGVDLDRLTITNGAKVVELQRVNQVWRMTSPLKAARADHPKINELLHDLQNLQVAAFQPEGNPGGLEAFGLQPPVWELAIFKGTNQLFDLQFGKSPTNDDTQIFARQGGRNAVVLVRRDKLNPWRAEYNQFRDPRLAGWITAPLDAIEVRGPVENFTLQRTNNANNDYWRIIAPSRNWLADSVLMLELIKTLVTLEVTNYNGVFANDSATDKELADDGLKEPARKYVLTRSAAGPAGTPTNQVVAELDFGARKDDILFARRGDLPETNTVYTVRAADIDKLPTTMLGMREHRLWNLNLDNVSEIDVRANGLLSQYQRLNEHEWALKQGTWDTDMKFAVGGAAIEIAELRAQTWVGWGDQALADHGFTDKSVAIELIFTEKGRLMLRLGGLSPNGLRYGATRLEDGEWVFEIPSLTMDRLTAFLRLPPFP